MQQFDIVIVGGGLVGACLARAMAGPNLKIAVIDQQPADALYSSSLDNRGLALSYASVKILTDLKIWSLLEAVAHPIKTVHVSEQNCFGFTKLSASRLNLPVLGYVVSASAIGAALICGLEYLPNITVMRPVTINSADYDSKDGVWNLTVADQKLKAKLLVAADGSNSFLRTKQNIPAVITDCQQSAIVTNLRLQKGQIDVAYERFTPQGVLALLPFGDRQLKCVWTVHNSKLAILKDLSDHEFLAVVQAAFGFRLGRFVSVAERKIFPIQTVQASSLYAEGLVLLGNAANTLHPVAAQGFNLALRDIVALTKVLQTQNYNLKDYALLRSKDHQATQNYTNTLVDLFASDIELLKLWRRLGLLAAQFIPALNKNITARGMGVWTS